MGQLVQTISQYWGKIQETLFPWLEEELDPLTKIQQQLISILEHLRIEQFVPNYGGYEGRPQICNYFSIHDSIVCLDIPVRKVICSIEKPCCIIRFAISAFPSAFPSSNRPVRRVFSLLIPSQ